ncbi:hypothetical protein GBAR_LOCUS13172, partial [Geodia barretti]
MAPSTSFCICILALLTLFNPGRCDCCEYFDHFSWTFGPAINISLEGSAYLNMMAYHIGPYICNDYYVYWEILRDDGETEVYTVANQDEYHYGRYETLEDRGLS